MPKEFTNELKKKHRATAELLDKVPIAIFGGRVKPDTLTQTINRIVGRLGYDDDALDKAYGRFYDGNFDDGGDYYNFDIYDDDNDSPYYEDLINLENSAVVPNLSHDSSEANRGDNEASAEASESAPNNSDAKE